MRIVSVVDDADQLRRANEVMADLRKEKVKFGGTKIENDDGDANMQYNLGVSYSQRYGGPQDYAEAARWYRKAAGQGHMGALYNLGMMLEDGSGMTQSYTDAARLYLEAAKQGAPTAQRNLARLYHGATA